MPMVSIIVPVHNTEKYLRSCVASIVAQTLKNIEIILVENASSDGSLALCHELAAEDDRIKVIHLDEGGLSLARNEGVKVASGDYIGFIDSDDTISPDMFETLYSHALEHDLDLVNSNFLRRYDAKPDRFVYPETGEVKIMSNKEYIALNMMEKVPVNACMMLFRKSLFNKVKFPVNRYFEDRASTYKFGAEAKRVGHVYKTFYYYYQRGDGICRSPEWKKYRDWVSADLERIEFLKDSDLFTDKEKLYLSSRPATSYFRKMRHLMISARSREEKEMTRAFVGKMDTIPKGCNISLYARLIKYWLKLKSI